MNRRTCHVQVAPHMMSAAKSCSRRQIENIRLDMPESSAVQGPYLSCISSTRTSTLRRNWLATDLRDLGEEQLPPGRPDLFSAAGSAWHHCGMEAFNGKKE